MDGSVYIYLSLFFSWLSVCVRMKRGFLAIYLGEDKYTCSPAGGNCNTLSSCSFHFPSYSKVHQLYTFRVTVKNLAWRERE